MLALEIRPLATREDRNAFRALNEEWITRHFVLEPADREILEHPETAVLGKGGHIFMVYDMVYDRVHDSSQEDRDAVGCVALIPMGEGVYELSKMAVSPALRGAGIGRRLLEHAIQQARSIGATSLFLGSSRKLKNAVHLYESVGFRHVPPERIPPLPYTRADVFMELQL